MPKTITDRLGNVWDYTANGWYIQRRPEGGHYADDRYDYRSYDEIDSRWGVVR